MAEKTAIISPLPGIFYRRPSPDMPEYVQAGEAIKEGDVIGLIEVMKNYYEIKAEADGIVDQFVVGNGELVDAGQELVTLIK